MQNVNVKISEDLIARLDAEARERDRTRSYILRQRLAHSYETAVRADSAPSPTRAAKAHKE